MSARGAETREKIRVVALALFQEKASTARRWRSRPRRRATGAAYYYSRRKRRSS
jgi:hypothetical protein